MIRIRYALIVACVLAASVSTTLSAQYDDNFGQNKVLWSPCPPKDESVMRGPHVDVHYCKGVDSAVAGFSLAEAEARLDTLSAKFNLPFSEIWERPQVHVFPSQHRFEETNIVSDIISEGLLGVTEFDKFRIAYVCRSFYGSTYFECKHTLDHEFVHWFQLQSARHACKKIAGMPTPDTLIVDSTSSTVAEPKKNGRHGTCNSITGMMKLPLWFVEGDAEALSSGDDSRDEMLVRDLVLSGAEFDFKQLLFYRGYFVYPLGGMFVRYLRTRFGDDKVLRLYTDISRYGGSAGNETGFSRAFYGIFGKKLETVSKDFTIGLQKKYYPIYGVRTRVDSSLIIPNTGTAYDMHPLHYTIVAPSTNDSAKTDTLHAIMYISSSDGVPKIKRDVFAQDSARLVRRSHRTVFAGESDKMCESFPVTSGFDVQVTPSEEELVFSCSSRGRDGLNIWGIGQGKRLAHIASDSIYSILSPSWCTNGTQIVFEGVDAKGYSDLYMASRESGTITRLTNDVYTDHAPRCSPNGAIAFISDRTPFGKDGGVNVFLLDPATSQISQLTYGLWHDGSPKWSADGSTIVFTSDRNGFSDAYEVNMSGHTTRVTNFASGIFEPNFISRTEILFAGYYKG